MKTIKQENFPQEGNNTAPVVLERILQTYATPSFGSMSKRDIDILMFTALQYLGIIDSNPQIYDVVRLLHITRAKARNLIYESTLRRQEVDKMDAYLKKELERVIVKPKFLKEGDKVCIEIDNPLLIDYVRQQLRDLNHITDGSFSPELVKMTATAFSDLYTTLLPEASLNQIKDKLISLGLERDSSPKAIIKMVFKAIGTAALGKAGEELVDYTTKVAGELGNWIGGVLDNIPTNIESIPGTIFEGTNIV